MHSEQICIDLARAARRRAISRKLQELEAERVSIDLSFVRGFRVEWRPTLGGKLLQALALPLVFVIQTVVLLWAPIGLLNNVRALARKKQELRQRFSELDQNCRAEFPAEKCLVALWDMHGLTDGEFLPGERIELLCEWIDILYGHGTAARFDLERRRGAIVRGHVDANAAYYRGEPNAPHFSFVDPIDTVVAQISTELPLYVADRR